jgi:transcription initiation factor TFIID subunit 1, fungi type
MLVGEQWLRDAGYAASLDYSVQDDDDDSLDIEVQLAPWTITRNFLQASQGKCMLRLHGTGDPTGIGEGFSFIKTSMKEMFFKAGESSEEKLAMIDSRRMYHKYSIAEQQQAYKEEVNIAMLGAT